MERFGMDGRFAIYTEYFLNKLKGDPVLKESPMRWGMGGDVYFFVNGKNLFQYKGLGPEATYSYDLNILVELFCDYLIYHISDDHFPVKTNSLIGAEMMDETNLIEGDDSDLQKWAEVDWDNVDSELYEKIDLWNVRHGFLVNRGGSLLPNIFVQKVDDKIEISWRNNFSHKTSNGEVAFEYEQGVEYIDLKLYRDTVVEFCLDFINKFKDKYPQKMAENMSNLKKAMDIVL